MDVGVNSRRVGEAVAMERPDSTIPGEISSEWSPVIARGIVTGRPILAVSRIRDFRPSILPLNAAVKLTIRMKRIVLGNGSCNR